MTAADASRRLSLLLALSFALTVLSFFIARIVSERQAAGITSAVATITDDTVPGTDFLATLRTSVWSTNSRLNEIVNRRLPSVSDSRDALLGERKKMIDAWQSYVRLPYSPGERELAAVADTDMAEVNASVDRVLQLLAQGDREQAVDEINTRSHQAIAKFDGATEAIATLDRRVAVEEAHRIADLRASSRRWGFALDAVSALLALVSAYFVIRVARAFSAESARRAAEMEAFAGRVAHDIRSPLGTVSVALDLAKRRTTQDPTTTSLLDRGMTTLGRVGQVVDGLLLFAAAGKAFTAKEASDVGVVLRGVVEDMMPAAEQEGIELEYEEPPSKLEVRCSSGVLVSIVSNLVVNAIQHMGDAATRQIALRAQERAKSVRIEVADTGPGLPPALRSEIFHPFTKPLGVREGLNLGLATTRRLVESHDGTIGVEQNIGGGSVFWVELPKWSGPPDFATRREAAHPRARTAPQT